MPKDFSTTGPRALWPTIGASRQVARCSIQAQLLFDRLICQADDQGRLQGDPVLVKAHCMPLVPGATPGRIARWLDELAGVGLIVRYETDGEPLIQATGWWKYQGGQRWIYRSRWPAPEGWSDRPPKTPTRTEESHDGAGVAPAEHGRDAGVTPAVAGAGAKEVAGAGAGANGSAPLAATLEAHDDFLTANLHLTYEGLCGHAPHRKEQDWIDDLIRQFGRDSVFEAMIAADAEPKRPGYLDRVTGQLRGTRK